MSFQDIFMKYIFNPKKITQVFMYMYVYVYICIGTYVFVHVYIYVLFVPTSI